MNKHSIFTNLLVAVIIIATSCGNSKAAGGGVDSVTVAEDTR